MSRANLYIVPALGSLLPRLPPPLLAIAATAHNIEPSRVSLPQITGSNYCDMEHFIELIRQVTRLKEEEEEKVSKKLF